jgi:hypothetical protein
VLLGDKYRGSGTGSPKAFILPRQVAMRMKWGGYMAVCSHSFFWSFALYLGPFWPFPFWGECLSVIFGIGIGYLLGLVHPVGKSLRAVRLRIGALFFGAVVLAPVSIIGLQFVRDAFTMMDALRLIGILNCCCVFFAMSWLSDFWGRAWYICITGDLRGNHRKFTHWVGRGLSSPI